MRVGDFKPLFGRNIRYLRTFCRMSQRTLGLLSGVPAHEIKVLENAVGVVHLDSVVFLRILQVFGVEMADVMDRDLQKEDYRLPLYEDAYYPAVFEDRSML